MITKSVCVLASGGVDSAILLGEAIKKFRTVQPVYVRGGFVWEKAELFWLKKYLRALRQPALQPLAVLDLPFADLSPRHWGLTRRGTPGARSRDAAVYIPGRNLLLLSKAGVFCAQEKIGRIWLGTLAANPFADATPAFFTSMARTLSLGLKTAITIEAPFRKFKKKDILRFSANLPLQYTFSCLAPRGLRPCGRCNKCEEKRRALAFLPPK
jgi:7-cyano-7-deazaguanine synthase